MASGIVSCMWFIFALLSALFAGLHTFTQKLSVERKYDIYFLNAIGSLISFSVGLLIFTLTASWSSIPFSVYLFGGICGALFIAFTIGRMEALRFIDSAIFFPLYKVIGPAITAVIGISLLHDNVSLPGVIGIALSCLIPLLLISKNENHRQKNLLLGLVLMVVSTALAAVSAALNDYALHGIVAYALPLLVVSHGCAVVFSVTLFLRRHKRNGIQASASLYATKPFIAVAIIIGILQFLSFYTLLLAFLGGNLSVVYSINAHYILIPVLLSVWIYKEHWNFQKAFALVLSLLALALLH